MNSEVAERLKLPVAGLRQGLMEHAATGSPKPLEDAEQWASRFRTAIKEIPAKCAVCHEGRLRKVPDADGKAARISSAFENFYSIGRSLASTKDSALSEGIKQEFDHSANVLSAEIDSLAKTGREHGIRAWAGMSKRASLVRSVTFWGSAAVVIIGIAISVVISARMEKPIIALVASAGRIADGDLSGKDLISRTGDEVGSLTAALNRMKNSLREIIVGITETSDQVASSSEELSSTVLDIKNMLEEQARRAEQAAASTTEMSQTVVDVARNASDIAGSADETSKVAKEGAGVIEKTVSEVRGIADTFAESSRFMALLGERSKQIGQIVGVINEIADQTNLLALNAAIEAARAGEQGRGFAVVADEVRKLAERTAKATTEISDMITAIQQETERAVSSIEGSMERVKLGAALSAKAGEALDKILASVNGLQSMVQQIASATEEMSSTSEMISSDIESIAVTSAGTSKNASDISEAAVNLAKLSSDLKGLTSRFRTDSKARGAR